MNKNTVGKIVVALITSLVLLAGAELFLRFQHFVQLDHFKDSHPWNPVFHHGAGKFVVKEFGSNCQGRYTKLLLLGDSWMEDKVLSSEIGREFAMDSGHCVQAVNGGNSSYAPTIYMLRARQAFEQFGKFDGIIVNIDETDIGDEWVRYRIPAVRDESGTIVRVPFSRDLHSEYLWNGKLWAEDSPLYLIRLVKFAFFYKVLVPLFYELTYCPDYPTLMTYLYTPDTRTRFARELAYFDDRLLEMTQELSGYADGVGSIYITYHPHLHDLVADEITGKTYQPVISEALSRLKMKTGVKVLDAREQVEKIHGKRLLDDTFEEGDPFSHLITDGASRYGKWIADQIDL